MHGEFHRNFKYQAIKVAKSFHVNIVIRKHLYSCNCCHIYNYFNINYCSWNKNSGGLWGEGRQHWFAHHYCFSNCSFPKNSSLQYWSEVRLKHDPYSAFDGLGDFSEGAIPLTVSRRWILGFIFFFSWKCVCVC